VWCVCVCVCVSVCDLETSTIRRPGPQSDCRATEKETKMYRIELVNPVKCVEC